MFVDVVGVDEVKEEFEEIVVSEIVICFELYIVFFSFLFMIFICM